MITLTDIQSFYSQYAFELVIACSIVIILVLACFHYGKRGSYTSSFYYRPTPTLRRSRQPPQTSSGERMCRRVLESVFHRPFPKTRPDFLLNPVTGGKHRLEIDCYNEDLKLGVEYSGVQHYQFSPFFHRTKEAFMAQKYRDHMKREMCVKNGVCLIVVPYTIPTDQIGSYLLTELANNGYLPKRN